MTAEIALIGILLAPLARAALVVLLARPPGLRDVMFVSLALFAAACGARLVTAAQSGEVATLVLAQPLPNVSLAIVVEPFGALMAAIMTGLAAVQALHAAGLSRTTASQSTARLFAFMSLATAAATMVALSANLFTLFVACQALTLAAFPLTAHQGDDAAREASRVFLATLLSASVGLFLPAMVWTYASFGALDFQSGGIMAGRADAVTTNALLALFVLGVGLAAVPPLHRWLTVSSAAPVATIPSLQALAVLPAGGVAIVKIGAFVFGPALLEARLAAYGLIVLAGSAMCAAAIIALSKQNAQERFAYSFLAQAMAVVIGVLLALPMGLFAAALQLVAFMCAATTVTMVLGTVSAVTARDRVSDFVGLGRIMPWTFGAFAVACASLIGMPPFSGAWAKLWLITAAAGAGLWWAAALVGVASVLTFAHLGPLAANALSGGAPSDAFKRPDGASIALVAPVVIAAAATLLLLIWADALAAYLAPMWTPNT